MNPPKRLLLFATKLGYQTRSFNAAAEKLGVELALVTDRCGRMDDPWNDQALSALFESPETAARAVLEAQRGLRVDGVLALGDRPGPTAAYVARGLGCSTITRRVWRRAGTSCARGKCFAKPEFQCRGSAASR